jgi:hypothetical protein
LTVDAKIVDDLEARTSLDTSRSAVHGHSDREEEVSTARQARRWYYCRVKLCRRIFGRDVPSENAGQTRELETFEFDVLLQ